jgi:hypothetical protein
MQSELSSQEYLYCFLRETEPQVFTSKGMGDRGDPVTTIHYRDLAAVVSASTVKKYENTRRNMLTHTRVLEEVMERYSILPVRFNTITPDREAICQLLHYRYDELQDLLNGIMGKVEMGLKALWYEGVVFNQLLDEHADIRRLRDSLQGRPAEQTYYERIHLGEMIETALRQKREEEEARILALLRPYAYEVKTSALISDHMIVNASFLVDRQQEPALDAEIQALDAALGRKILFRYVGPVPPYNFVNIMLAWNGANN